MSLSDTESLGRQWCPRCEPEADPITEILIVRWCWQHAPSLKGTADADVPDGHPLSVGEAEGVDCALMAAVLRRGTR